MNQYWGTGNVRDWWGRWSPAAIHNLSWLNNPDCFRPKMAAAPLQGAASIAASGYVLLNVPFIPGSWLMGLSQVNGDSLDFALTDMATNYAFQTAPLSMKLLDPSGAQRSPFWLPEPYMMAGAALLRVELWNNTAVATTDSQLVIHFLEPREV